MPLYNKLLDQYDRTADDLGDGDLFDLIESIYVAGHNEGISSSGFANLKRYVSSNDDWDAGDLIDIMMDVMEDHTPENDKESSIISAAQNGDWEKVANLSQEPPQPPEEEADELY